MSFFPSFIRLLRPNPDQYTILIPLFFLSVSGCPSNCLAQGIAYIKGTVKDPQGHALPGATISLQSIAGGRLVQQGLSDDQGRFIVRISDTGIFLIRASLVGFVPLKNDTLTVPHRLTGDIQLDLIMIPHSSHLKEVVVTHQQEPIGISSNKTVLQVQNTALSSGASAYDLLRRLPGISIGQDEQLMLKGDAGLQVMLDGKMTYLSGRQLIELLKSMNASNINRIELINAPSAEYDAAGNAGMINIVTRKNMQKGYAIDITSGISKGRYRMFNENITASLRTRKLTLHGSFDFNTPDRYFRSYSGNTILENGEPVLLRRTNESSFRVKFYTYRAGADWQLLPGHRLSVAYSGYYDDFRGNKSSQVAKFPPHELSRTDITSTNIITEPYHYDAANISYTIDLDTNGKKITAEAHTISYRNYSDALLSSVSRAVNGQPAAQENLRSRQPGFITIRSLKADAVLPFSFLSMKAGVKYAHVSNDNNFRFDSLVNGQYTEATTMSNHFKYREEIAAIYLSASKKTGRTGIQAGLRLEHTLAKGYTVKQAVGNKWEYTKLFPSVSVDHAFGKDHAINLSVSRRINRPTYADLNPVRWYNDQYFFYSGNSSLRPEMAWLISSTYTWKNKYLLTGSYNQRVDYLSRRLTIEAGTQALVSQTANFDKMHRFDLSIVIPFTPLNGWKVQFSSGINYTSYPISQLNSVKQLSQWAGNLLVNQQIKLPQNIMVEITTSWTSEELLGIYRKATVFFMDAGIKKTLVKAKLDAKLSFADLFGTNRYKGRSLTDYTDYYYQDKPDSRRIGFSLTWHLGGKPAAGQVRRIEEQDRL